MGHTSGVAGLGTTTFVSGNYEKKMGHLAGISSVGIYLCMICFCLSEKTADVYLGILYRK